MEKKLQVQMGGDEMTQKGHDLVSVMSNQDSFLRCLPWRFIVPFVLADGQMTDAKIEQETRTANAHDKFLASLYQWNDVYLHQIEMSYFQNKLVLSISLQRFWSEMNALIIVDVISIHLVSPWLNESS